MEAISRKYSKFIGEAIIQYAGEIKRLQLGEQLKTGYLVPVEKR